jgi:hypothetical protein
MKVKVINATKNYVVKDHVCDIILELCKIPTACEEFRLGDGVWFDIHATALDEVE